MNLADAKGKTTKYTSNDLQLVEYLAIDDEENKPKPGEQCSESSEEDYEWMAECLSNDQLTSGLETDATDEEV